MTKSNHDESGGVFSSGFSRYFKSRLAGDALALSAAHFLGLVVPFVTVPYLARVLRPEGFGLLIFAQSFGLWLVLVIEYGFDLSGTRGVSRIKRGDLASLSELVIGIQSAKILALFLTIPVAVTALFTVPLFRDNPAYLIWGLAFAVARGLSPNWYFFGQERMIASQARGPLTDPEYLNAMSTIQKANREDGIDRLVREHNLDAIVAPTRDIPWPTDHIKGDRSDGGSSAGPAAIAGYPDISVPMGFVSGLPVGVSFFGRAWSEPTLIKIAYAYEQVTQHRRAPTFAETLG